MRNNRGFSLIELMVAMVIGLIIILGAGQLFLTVFQTNRQVLLLSEKQAAINFAVEGLLRDIRRADWAEFQGGAGDDELVLQVPSRGELPDCEIVEKTYSLVERSGQSFLSLEMECIEGEALTTVGPDDLVGGFASSGFEIEPVGVYGVRVALTLLDSGGGVEMLEFTAVNRTAAVSDDPPEEDEE
jgi:prepilin-type N-terminal cleavage/methylation domain-containing protein